MKKGLRYNKDKPKWSLVDFNALEPLVRVLEFGMAKYTRENWKKGLKETEILDSLQRHVIALMSGEKYDKDSGTSHIGGILFNAMAYSRFYVKDSINPNIKNWGKFLKKRKKKYVQSVKQKKN